MRRFSSKQQDVPPSTWIRVISFHGNLTSDPPALQPRMDQRLIRNPHGPRDVYLLQAVPRIL